MYMKMRDLKNQVLHFPSLCKSLGLVICLSAGRAWVCVAHTYPLSSLCGTSESLLRDLWLWLLESLGYPWTLLRDEGSSSDSLTFLHHSPLSPETQLHLSSGLKSKNLDLSHSQLVSMFSAPFACSLGVLKVVSSGEGLLLTFSSPTYWAANDSISTVSLFHSLS